MFPTKQKTRFWYLDVDVFNDLQCRYGRREILLFLPRLIINESALPDVVHSVNRLHANRFRFSLKKSIFTDVLKPLSVLRLT